MPLSRLESQAVPLRHLEGANSACGCPSEGCFYLCSAARLPLAFFKRALYQHSSCRAPNVQLPLLGGFSTPLLSSRNTEVEPHRSTLQRTVAPTKGVDTPLRARHSASCISVSPAKSVAPLSEMRRQARDLEKSRRRHSPVLGGRAARNRG